MKILHVITTLSPFAGGPTVVLKAMAYAQAKQGNEVAICTTNGDHPWGELSVPTNRPVITDQVAIWYFTMRYFRPLCVSTNLSRWIDKNVSHYDIVHVHGLYRFPTTYAAWRARKAGVPYFIRPHGSLDPFLYKQSRYCLPLKRIYERLFDIPNLNHATAIDYTTQEEAERAVILGLRSKSFIVPNGIDWRIYADLSPKGLFRKKLGINNQTRLVLFLGRINFKKGLDLLVPAFARVTQANPKARLAVVGPDNEGYGSKVRQWCRGHGIEDKVLFVGHLSSEEVKQAYVDADVFVLPSYTENFGLTVVEAMASATPVVISDQVNIHREVRKAGAGIVVPLDPKKIAEAICCVLEDKHNARAMGRRGRKLAEERYAWHRIVEQLTKVYQRFVIEAASKRSS